MRVERANGGERLDGRQVLTREQWTRDGRRIDRRVEDGADIRQRLAPLAPGQNELMELRRGGLAVALICEERSEQRDELRGPGDRIQIDRVPAALRSLSGGICPHPPGERQGDREHSEEGGRREHGMPCIQLSRAVGRMAAVSV